MNTYFQVDNSLSINAWRAARGRVRLGLCCINNTLNTDKKNRIYVNRKCTRDKFTTELALDLALKNVTDLKKILEWNEAHNIRHYRLSSDMFPHYTDTETEKYKPTPEIIEALKAAGDFANQHNHRITMHPGQYNVVGTPDPDVFQKTVEDLTMHAWILDTMNISSEGVLCVHGGGVYGDKENTIRRWIEQFDDLPRTVKNRLAIENCEKCYSVEDCLHIANECKIPHIYDSHHYYCYNYLHPDEEIPHIEELMGQIIETWDRKGCNPLFHISDQADTNIVGQHHDFIKEIPAHMLNVPKLFDRSIDIEVEAKAKEEAIFRLYKNYYPLW